MLWVMTSCLKIFGHGLEGESLQAKLVAMVLTVFKVERSFCVKIVQLDGKARCPELAV